MKIHPRVKRGLIAFHTVIVFVALLGAFIILWSKGQEPFVWYGVIIMLLSPFLAYLAGIIAYKRA